jgi:hypothetical protein
VSRSLVATLFVPPAQCEPRDVAATLAALRKVGFTARKEPGARVRSWTNAEDGHHTHVTDGEDEALRELDGTNWWGIRLFKRYGGAPASWADLALDVIPPTNGGLGTIVLALPRMPRLDEAPTLAQEFASWVALLADLTHPWYGWGGSDLGLFNRETEPVAAADVAAVALQSLEWLNVYGEPYVQRLGRERLLTTPAWRADVLAGGGVAVVLGRHPFGVDRREAEAVAAHLGVPLPS